jgi:hypothetical protein
MVCSFRLVGVNLSNSCNRCCGFRVEEDEVVKNIITSTNAFIDCRNRGHGSML